LIRRLTLTRNYSSSGARSKNESTKIDGLLYQEKTKIDTSIQSIKLQIKNATQQAKPLEGLNCQNPTCQLIKGAVEARDKIPGLKEQLESETTKFENGNFAEDLKLQKELQVNKLMDIDIQVEILDYDQAAHQDLKTKLIELERYERLVASLENAEESKRLAQEQIDQIHATVKEKQDDLTEQISQANVSIKEKLDVISGFELDKISLEDDAKEAF